jgi:hypothetical protein
VLLLLMPPSGFLLDNEENYFALAARAFSGTETPATSALFDDSPHRLLNELLLGSLVSAVGFETAQIVARSASVLCYSLLLGAIFRGLRLSTLDGVLIIAVFGLIGQSLFGGEWLFRGYEAKIPAYCLVLGGYVLGVLRRRPVAATLLFALATYFHFLVGAFWFVAYLGRAAIERPLRAREIGIAAGLYALATAPFFRMFLWSRIEDAGRLALLPGEPSPDRIYSIIRAPHHAAPFLSWGDFVSSWLPGYLLAAAMLGGGILIARKAASTRLKATAIWLAWLLGFLFLALLLSYFDRATGVLGKFYLFRPAALVLLFWLALALAFLNDLEVRHFTLVKRLAAALVVPLLAWSAALGLKANIDFDAVYGREKRALATFLAGHSSRDDVVLIDPMLEPAILDFERVTRRPSLVMWKFDATNAPQILEWYRRIEFRKSLFAEGCPARTAYRVDFLLTAPDRAAGPASRCGAIVFRTDHFLLLGRER